MEQRESGRRVGTPWTSAGTDVQRHVPGPWAEEREVRRLFISEVWPQLLGITVVPASFSTAWFSGV
jgi:hypothetical protein